MSLLLSTGALSTGALSTGALSTGALSSRVRWSPAGSGATAIALALLAVSAPGRVGGDEAKASPERVRELAAEVIKENPLARRRAARELAAAGPAAREEAIRARDSAPDPQARAAFDWALRWIAAGELRPILLERQASGLTFEGQYSDLRAKGKEAVDALLAILDDEESEPVLRLAALHALADAAGPGDLPRVRRIRDDPLLAPALREELETLSAVLGDSAVMAHRIKDLEALAARSTDNPLQKVQRFQDLANLHYRIRRYEKAVESYDRALAILEKLLEGAEGQKNRSPALERAISRELALAYYNTACSLSLAGKLERAKELLKKAAALQPVFLENMEKDGDLKPLRESPGYGDWKKALEKPLEKKSI